MTIIQTALTLLFSTLLHWVATPAMAAMTPTERLSMMNHQLTHQNMEGRFVHRVGNEMRSIRYLHANIDNVEHERITQLNGPMAEIIRKGDELTCILPGKKAASLYKKDQPTPLHRRIAEVQSQLDQIYHISETQGHRIAGLNAIQINAQPKDRHRLHYQFWLDPETSLLMKSQTLDDQGNVLESFEFTSLTLMANVSASDFSINPDVNPEHIMEHKLEGPTEALKIRWTITWLPEGFQAADNPVVNNRSALETMAMKMYTDGLSSFSIFFEPVTAKATIPPTSQHGATLFTTRLFQLPNHPLPNQPLPNNQLPKKKAYTATLVGDIPPETGYKIIESINVSQ